MGWWTKKTRLVGRCEEGIKRHFGSSSPENRLSIRERMEYEIHKLDAAGFIDTFLLAAETVEFAGQECLLVGPGRGTIPGSMVAYLAGITKVDPVEHGLLFERFLLAPRKTGLTIELDVSYDGYERLSKYLEERQDNQARDQVAVLPLDALSIMENVITQVHQKPKMKDFVDKIPLFDEHTLGMIGDAMHFESLLQALPATVELIDKGFRVNEFSDLVALLRLSQEMTSPNLAWAFLLCRTGECRLPEVRAEFVEFLSETGGFVLYQEQVLEILHQFGDVNYADGIRFLYSLRDLDGRDELDDSDKDYSDWIQEKFIKGCKSRGYGFDSASEIWRRLALSGFGFPKAHLVAYALICNWLAHEYVEDSDLFDSVVEEYFSQEES